MLDYILNNSKDKDCVIIYMTGNKITKRKIHIYKIDDSYIMAYCHLKHEMRTFKRDGILSATPVRRCGSNDP